MKRLFLATLIALGLSGCAQFNRWFDLPSNQTPVVVVSGGEVKAVNPDPLRFSKDQGQVTIYWQAPGGYRFAAKGGIFVDGELVGGAGGRPAPQDEIVGCAPSNADRTEFSCVNKNSRPGTHTYKYTVNLETADGKPLKPFDPSIINGANL